MLIMTTMAWGALPVLAELSRTAGRPMWVGYVIALVLVAGAALASLMTSRRTHRD
ncbi:MAG: hypothetical protein WD042_08515 [Phycisphaeraceae bacterium]